MSILIKGMAMPKNCDECRIMTYEDTNCISVHELFCGCPIVFRAHPQHEEHRPDYCPLVELPPHEDLIGRNAAIRSAFKGEQNIYCWDEIEEALDGVPAIIESEE